MLQKQLQREWCWWRYDDGYDEGDDEDISGTGDIMMGDEDDDVNHTIIMIKQKPIPRKPVVRITLHNVCIT